MVWSVVFSGDGRLIASGSFDHLIRLWKADTGEHIKPLVGHTDLVLDVAFSGNSGLLASCSKDQTIRLWDGVTGDHRDTLTGHTDIVYSVALNTDGSLLASGGFDRTVHLWKLTPVTTVPPVTTPLEYDVTGDGAVDHNDFYVVVAQFGLRDAPATTDSNGDGYIDVQDIRHIDTKFAFQQLPAELQAVEVKHNIDFNDDGTISEDTQVFAITTHADLNDDGVVNFEDIELIVRYLQASGDLPAAPQPSQLFPRNLPAVAHSSPAGVGHRSRLSEVIAASGHPLASHRNSTPVKTTRIPSTRKPGYRIRWQNPQMSR